jgi:hypothetical protein
MVQYVSGSETTQRESLVDTITVRSPAATPLIRSLPHVSIPNRVHEWSIDEPFKSTENIRNPGSPHENSRLEGDSFTVRTPFYPTRLRAIAEIAHFGFEISNTDRTVVAAGMESTFDYRSGQLFAMLLNYIENILMYGQGSPTTAGSSGADERRCQGLIPWAGHTGLERVHGAGTLDNITDNYGISIPSGFWSTFYDANSQNLSRSMFYNKMMATAMRAGSDFSTGWVFHAGYKTMGLISQVLTDPAGQPINQRNIDASLGGGYDFINWLKVPSGEVVGFRTNRYLDIEGSTYTLDPAGTLYTPGAPASPGGVTARTMQADETLIGYEPGAVELCWLRPPHFLNVPTTADKSQVAAVAEFTLKVNSPLCVAGIGNCIA